MNGISKTNLATETQSYFKQEKSEWDIFDSNKAAIF